MAIVDHPAARSSVLLYLSAAATARAHLAGEDAWWLCAREVLSHTRTSFVEISGRDSLSSALDEASVLIICGPPDLDDAVVARVEAWVREGGVAVVTDAGAADHGDRVMDALDHLCGAPGGKTWLDQHVTLLDNSTWTSQPPGPLHAIQGRDLDARDGVEILARRENAGRASAGVITRRSLGRGHVLRVGVDLWQTIVSIRQGRSVDGDGTPPADGSAPVDDGVLKAEDGIALDYVHDRALPPETDSSGARYEHTYPPSHPAPMFHIPQADWWAILFHQLAWWAKDVTGQPHAWLHYWPAGVPAVAHMSHDADRNDDADAEAALSAFEAADVTVTWCHVFPGGYSPQTRQSITDAGHENALHFNAVGDADLASWGHPQLRAQHAWAQAVSQDDAIVSNKNHYTRWEGWTEFYLWCEDVGIEIDESRGPSKQGTAGFPFGASHVAFPMADAVEGNRSLNVLDLPLHLQDLVWAGDERVRDVVLDAALSVHGVAHVLFHGPHLRNRPDTRAACLELAAAARTRGMSWWTAGDINRWERARRQVQVDIAAVEDGWTVSTHSTRALPNAAVVLHLPAPDGPETVEVTGSTGAASLIDSVRHGRLVHELAVDIPQGTGSWHLRRREPHD